MGTLEITPLVKDALQTSAILLAILLPLVTSIFTYRREERKRTEERSATASVGRPGLVAIGGALASHGDTLEYVNAMARQTEALDRQSEFMERLALANAELAAAHRDRAAALKDFLDETELIRRALQEVVYMMRGRGLNPSSPSGP